MGLHACVCMYGCVYDSVLSCRCVCVCVCVCIVCVKLQKKSVSNKQQSLDQFNIFSQVVLFCYIKLVEPGNTDCRGRLSTDDLLIKSACFVEK